MFTNNRKYGKMITARQMKKNIISKSYKRKGESMYHQERVQQGLYDSSFEHDNCGIGAVVNIKGIKSHATVSNALKIVENLEHRAGKDAEGKTGDGVGILVQISHKFFKKACDSLGIFIGQERDYGVGMFFMPQDELKRNRAKKMFEIIVEKEGLNFLGWREVPVQPEILGKKAKDCMPYIMQGFVKRPFDVPRGVDFDRRLYIVRRVYEQSNDFSYVVSLSSRTIVYKGMFLVGQLRNFYADLHDPDYESAIALVHSRFSTNTVPSWEKAHPYRYIVHNGEINTIRGNADKMLAREEKMESDYLKDEMIKLTPVVDPNGSDSARLDNTLEFLVMSGMPLPLAVMITIPEPWQNDESMSREKRDFYQYYATMMEPWDGPASILFSDGDIMGAVLDRNGLRPSRYYITDDDQLILSSEVGVVDFDITHIVKKERLHPGKMLLVDTVKGELIDDEVLKDSYVKKQPYGEWLSDNLVQLRDLKIPNVAVEEYDYTENNRLMKAFGYTYEDLKTAILPMALNGNEAIGAMGIDSPLPVLSKMHQPLFNYFKQMFAQVTNPPIDALREEIVTSTAIYIGDEGNILEEKAENCRVLKVNNPILTNTDLLKIRYAKIHNIVTKDVPITYYKGTNLEKAIQRLCIAVDQAHKNGATVVILTDRGVDENHVAIPSLLAVSAVHQHLIQTKKSTSVKIILESGEPREVHHFATLLGYGACAINPYMAQFGIKKLIQDGLLKKDYYAAVDDYNNAVLHGIVKIASKMGISTLQSYQGSQIFEAVGISKDVIDKYFTNTVSRVEGITLEDIAEDVDVHHSKAFDVLGLTNDLTLDSEGSHQYRSGKEEHLYNPLTIHTLQTATWTGNYEMFKQYTSMINKETAPITLRGLIDFNYPEKGIPIEEVEPVESIVKRFKTGAMSYGSISKEAHETLAIAMNQIHGKSNTGEGGEDLERLTIGPDGLNKCSAIKQVASGRFGVTAEYLVNADEIQIKVAQGAKPGEGGQLPGFKVNDVIAKTRHSIPGISLISPPPHHDIYSIEDLAQLIFDLKNVNPSAEISVKLVSESGVGTIAAGVAKAKADRIVISGAEGGTGASPISSIRYAGLPPELGLSETQQTLVMNNLRGQVRLQTDGQLKTGRDIVLMALLGAEEFGFATSALIVLGCVMMRKCHMNTCPVGVATQDEELRKRFHGRHEYLVNFFTFLAEEVREYLAEMGFRRLDDIIGRTDLIDRLSSTSSASGKYALLDFSKLLHIPAQAATNAIRHTTEQVHLTGHVKDQDIILHAMPAIEHRQEISLDYAIANTDRSVGAMLSGEIAKRYGDAGLPEHTLNIKFKGSAGQSFGAFLAHGVNFRLEGEANDYLGKGLSGGRISVMPPVRSTFIAENNTIAGNTLIYGATSGEVYINGRVGERFCVRNSGAIAVVEGVGDHCCEYMTGGRVVVLGRTGRNFAAGMSGGVAYVWNKEGDFDYYCNMEMVELSLIEDSTTRKELHELIRKHYHFTGSHLASKMLDNWDKYVDEFIQIVPIEYKKVLQEEQMKKLQQKIAEMQRDY